MMLSPAAYDLINVIVDGEVTVHTLRLGIIARGVCEKDADELLLNCLIELAEAGLIEWLIHQRYGDIPPFRPSNFGAVELLTCWQTCFGTGGPRGDAPDSSNRGYLER